MSIDSLSAATVDELFGELERRGQMHTDVLFDHIGGQTEHRYWSTYCRHSAGNPHAVGHQQCRATAVVGPQAGGDDPGELTAIVRRPAQCKVCAAPCRCPCHREQL